MRARNACTSSTEVNFPVSRDLRVSAIVKVVGSSLPRSPQPLPATGATVAVGAAVAVGMVVTTRAEVASAAVATRPTAPARRRALTGDVTLTATLVKENSAGRGLTREKLDSGMNLGRAYCHDIAQP